LIVASATFHVFRSFSLVPHGYVSVLMGVGRGKEVSPLDFESCYFPINFLKEKIFSLHFELLRSFSLVPHGYVSVLMGVGRGRRFLP